MNGIKKSINCILALCLWGGSLVVCAKVYAQNPEQRSFIVKNSNQNALGKLKRNLEQRQTIFQNATKGLLKTQKQQEALIGFGPDGSPLYFENQSIGKAFSPLASTESVLSNTLDLPLGSGMEIGVWDQGLPRESHQEFSGRVQLADPNGPLNYDHATMVTGLILARGTQQSAKGIAPNARALAFNWSQDRIEATEQAANGLLVSNHSYGISPDHLPEWYFGAYLKISADWDAIQYHAPYYLSVTASGNDTNTAGRVLGFNTAKNSLSVGAVNNESLAPRTAYAVYGPTDDGRIKPEIVAAANGLYSSGSGHDRDYGSGSGTSFAAPQVSGVALLVQELALKTQGAFLKAAALKGILMHTAKDLGVLGPDYERGWGLLQQGTALDFINGLGNDTALVSDQITHDAKTYAFEAGPEGLKVSLSWTDLPGKHINKGTTNPEVLQLVHDLDLRLYKDGQEYKPFVLDPNAPFAPATLGDNFRDPFEQIIVSEAGNYTIEVRHKGSLEAPQDFHLLVSGVAGNELPLATETEQNNTVAQNTRAINLPVEGNVNPSNSLLNIQETEQSEQNSSEVSLIAFPNPAVNTLKVKGLPSTAFKYYIYRSDGSVVGKGESKNGEVGVYRLSSGMYILGVYQEGSYHSLKFFKR